MRAALIAVLALAPATLAAQESIQGHDGRQPVPAVAGLETRVRFTVSDTTIQLNRPRPIGSVAQVEGRLVRFEGNFAVLEMKHGYTYTIPTNGLTSIEQRVGPGPCRRSAGRRAACTIATLGVGVGIGYAAGHKIGGVVDEFGENDGPATYARRGVLLGGAIAFAVLQTLGRDEWVVVAPGAH